MFTIADLDAHEILDSRGRPTVKASLLLESGQTGTVSVPSGASTGMHEAHELRDGDPQRYRGYGCLKAVDSVRQIGKAATSRLWHSQQELDDFLIALDGHSKQVPARCQCRACRLARIRTCRCTSGRPQPLELLCIAPHRWHTRAPTPAFSHHQPV